MIGWPEVFVVLALLALAEALVAWLLHAPLVFRSAVLAGSVAVVAAWVAADLPGWRALLFVLAVVVVAAIAVGLLVIAAAERVELDQVPTEEQP